MALTILIFVGLIGNVVSAVMAAKAHLWPLAVFGGCVAFTLTFILGFHAGRA
jgi:hypothetical protein